MYKFKSPLVWRIYIVILAYTCVYNKILLRIIKE